MPLKQLKQIIQIKHNIVKNPNWPEADQLAIYKCGRGFELGRSVKQIQRVARAGLEPGTAGLRVRRADHSATLPYFIYGLSKIGILTKLFEIKKVIKDKLETLSLSFSNLQNCNVLPFSAVQCKQIFVHVGIYTITNQKLFDFSEKSKADFRSSRFCCQANL